jgi:hypothetical protein
LLERQLERQEEQQQMRLGGGPSSSWQSPSKLTVDDDLLRRSISSPGGISSSATLHRPSASKKMVKRTEGLEILPPVTLPRRRRTHWDNVLQEMSWLASDFIEERKWKMSSSRLVSSKIPQHAQSILRANTIKTTSAAEQGNKKEPSTTTNVVSPVEPKNQSTKEEEELSDIEEAGTKSVADEEEDVKTKTDKKKYAYTVPSSDDEEFAKCCGRIISSMVLDLNYAIKKGGAIESTDKYHEEALKHFMKIRAEHKRQLAESRNVAALDESKPPSNETEKDSDNGSKMEIDEEKKVETSFEEITEKVALVHKTCKSRYKSTMKEFANALKSRKINFNPIQKDMIDFVDKLWTANPCSGAMILGPAISGKTFAAATLLWKHRTMGPQLLICPPKGVVSLILLFQGIFACCFGDTVSP